MPGFGANPQPDALSVQQMGDFLVGMVHAVSLHGYVESKRVDARPACILCRGGKREFSPRR